MTQVFDGKKFPLLDTLRATTPTLGGPESVGYDLAATLSIDRTRPHPGRYRASPHGALVAPGARDVLESLAALKSASV